jgi:ribosome biogenesis protein Nip4
MPATMDGEGAIKRGWVPGENQYRRKSKDEIRQLALDNMAGQVFGTWQMRESDLSVIRCVFLPLIAINDFHLKGWERDEIMHFYGHLKDSFSRSINGMPCFHSFHVINQSDLERVFKMQKLIDALDEPEDD